jgi:hypothetical protein
VNAEKPEVKIPLEKVVWCLPASLLSSRLAMSDRSRAYAAMWLTLDHMTKGEHIQEI